MLTGLKQEAQMWKNPNISGLNTSKPLACSSNRLLTVEA